MCPVYCNHRMVTAPPAILMPHVGWEDFPDSDNEEEVKCYVEMLAERAVQLD